MLPQVSLKLYWTRNSRSSRGQYHSSQPASGPSPSLPTGDSVWKAGTVIEIFNAIVNDGKTKLTQGPLQWDVTVGERDGALQTTWVSGNL